jgi:SanA protein
MKKLLRKKFIFRFSLISIVIGTAFLTSSYYWVENTTSEKCFTDVQNLTEHRVGLVLGTSKFTKSGRINPYFTYRVKAAAEAYKAGKIKRILISGDNGRTEYNEPEMFKEALIEKGVEAKHIELDFAGFRTLDSILRAWKVFGLKEFLIISQEFHNKRAVFIAEKNGLEVEALNATNPQRTSKRMTLREVAARANCILDLYILGTDPKFYGPEIEIK